jgi:hypothetical protein
VAAEEEKQRVALEEQLEAMERVEDLMKADLARKELRLGNSSEVVAVTQREMALNKKKLKADIKKTEKLLKKVRVVTETNATAICADIRKLNLKRYVAEVAAGVAEAELKRRADVVAAVSLCSTMHSLYADFVPSLLPVLTAVFEVNRER